MSYIVLARKYRPQTFTEVYAQDHITKILLNALEQDRVAHAYLFTGPRGVGKTSMARILAKSLNCQQGEKGHPCNHCAICEEITHGTSTDVVEIDGASNTGVDDIRDLQSDLLYTTNTGHYKIYIIDEVHMLSKNAFNALLKTLEEPPENVIFIFATTEPHKVLPTIISRCQRFDFKRIPIEMIVKNLKNICQNEHLEYEEEALFQIAKKADGGMRDALSLMDQVISTGEEVISEKIVREVFGILPFEVYNKILLAVNNGDSASVIKNLHSIIETGTDLMEIINGLLDYLRLSLLCYYNVETGEISKAQFDNIKSISSKFDDQDLLYIISLLMKTKVDMKQGENPAIILEIVLIKLSKIKDLVDIQAVNTSIQPLPPSNNSYQDKNHNYKVTTQGFSQNDKSTNVKEKKTPLKADSEPLTTEKTVGNHIKEKLKSITNNKKNDKLSSENKTVKSVIEPFSNKDSKFDLEFVNSNWDLLIKRVAKQDNMLASMLNYVKITNVTKNMISLSTERKMSSELINKNKDKLTSYLQAFYQNKVNFSLDYIDKEEEEEKELSMEIIQKEVPELAKLIKDTNSKIINRRSNKKDF